MWYDLLSCQKIEVILNLILLCHLDNCYIRERNGNVIYTGNINMTDNGLPCGRWDQIGLKYPLGPEHVNYCRNPDHDPKGLWCYLQWNRGWRYCNIPRCGKYMYIHCTSK